MSITSFNQDLKKLAKHMDATTEQLGRSIALDLFGRIVIKTPVDTGRARGNWQTNVGTPILSVTENTSEPSATFKRGDGYKVMYITNNLPYIGVLEDGGVSRPPHHMIKRSLSEVERGVKNVLGR